MYLRLQQNCINAVYINMNKLFCNPLRKHHGKCFVQLSKSPPRPAERSDWSACITKLRLLTALLR